MIPFTIGDSVIDFRNINNFDVINRRTRYGVITDITNTTAYVNINGVILEIPLCYLMLTSRLN